MANVLVDREYLENIANAIREKSGTSDLITPADMATAVEDIPVGPTPPPTPVDPDDPVGVQYGAVLYYKNVKESWYPYQINGGVLNSIDYDALNNFMEAYPGYQGQPLMYDDYEQKWMWSTSASEQGYIYIADSLLEQMTGVNFTKKESTSEMGMMEDRPQLYFTDNKVRVPADGETEFAICASQAEYDSLVNVGYANQDAQYTIGGVTIPKYCIKRFVFGSVPTTIPNYFLKYTSVESISDIPTNITSTGYGVLSYISHFNSPVNFKATTLTIGADFLMSCYQFDSPVTFASGSNVTMGDNFMSYCGRFNQPVDLTGVRTVGQNCFENMASFNSNVVFPFSLTSVGTVSGGSQMFFWCDDMTATVTCGCPASVFYPKDNPEWNPYGPFYGNSMTPRQEEGVKLTGPYAQDWYDTFSDQGGERKFVIV